MSTVLRILGSTMEGVFDRPQYLQAWDVDAFEGFGSALLTSDVREAHQFADFGEAMGVWKTQSTVKPFREHDGRPNRPLTAYTVEAIDFDKALFEDITGTGLWSS